MRLLPGGLLIRLVALVIMAFVGSTVHHAVGVGAIRVNVHERRQRHAEQWEEERKQMRSYMTMDYHLPSRRVPKHN